MKKLSKIVVKDQAETLNKEEMKLILGGSGYRFYHCCCGMGQVSQDDCNNIMAGSYNDAVYDMSTLFCSGGSAGCFYS